MRVTESNQKFLRLLISAAQRRRRQIILRAIGWYRTRGALIQETTRLYAVPNGERLFTKARLLYVYVNRRVGCWSTLNAFWKICRRLRKQKILYYYITVHPLLQTNATFKNYLYITLLLDDYTEGRSFVYYNKI